MNRLRPVTRGRTRMLTGQGGQPAAADGEQAFVFARVQGLPECRHTL
jgi:hypothetical protein